MGNERTTTGSGWILLVAALVIAAAIFAFVPMVECRRCQNGLYAYVYYDREGPICAAYFCDCKSVLSKRQGVKERISLLRALRRPRPWDP